MRIVKGDKFEVRVTNLGKEAHIRLDVTGEPTEEIHLTENQIDTSVRPLVVKESRREQFQKKPYKIYFAVALLIASVIVAFIDHDLSVPLGIILGVNGVAQTPINEKIIIKTRERFT